MRRLAHGVFVSKRLGDIGLVKTGEEFYGCSVMNLSLTGATLRLDNPMELPERFELRCGRMVQSCVLIWQDVEHARVEFQLEKPDVRSDAPQYAPAET